MDLEISQYQVMNLKKKIMFSQQRRYTNELHEWMAYHVS